MSTVGSITTTDPLYLQSVQGQNPSSATGRQRDGRQVWAAWMAPPPRSAGLDSTQVSQLHTDIQDAVKSALQNSAGNGENRGAVKDAVDSVLKKYGIDPTSVRPQHSGHAHRGHDSGKSGSSRNDGDADDGTPQNATDAAVATLLKGLPSGSLLDAAA